MSEIIQASRTDLTQAPSDAPLFVPRIDVLEETDGYVVHADLPGCDPQGIDVQYENGSLTIRGRVPERRPGGVLRGREYGVGDFLRRFNVTDSIDVEKISASYESGVLTLRLPKVETAKPRSIKVTGNG